MAKIRAHVFVSGRVQGVFFRSYTREKAQGLGLKGWVRNLKDGRVEALFEGEREKVEVAVDWCRIGPPYAKVTGFEVEWGEYKGEFNGFEVKYF